MASSTHRQAIALHGSSRSDASPPISVDRRKSRRRSLPPERAHERVPLETDVTLASDSHFFAGLSRDVSRGGIFVATYRAVPRGTRLALSITLPDGPLDVRGVVQWTQDARGARPGLGVVFEGLDAAAVARIERFCGDRAPLLYDFDDDAEADDRAS